MHFSSSLIMISIFLSEIFLPKRASLYNILITVTEREVRTGMYSICLKFSYRPSDEEASSVRKNRRKILSHLRTKQTRLIRTLLYRFLLGFLYHFIPVYLTYLLVLLNFCFLFPPVKIKHSSIVLLCI